ncbi:MAG: hypothetical protein K2Y32_11790 [Candidatus Obscuribacterales bacterium]|nr:hypothetical protein [Candidatus Obscuribacterales bacterium]
METILGLVFSSLIYLFTYQFLAPWFSGRQVTFSTPDFGPKFLFGLLMSVGGNVLMGLVVFTFAVLLLPFFLATAASPGPVVGLGTIALVGLVGLMGLQVTNWLMTMIAGKIMPGTISVPNSGAAWKAAWAPTLLVVLPYLLFVFLPIIGFSLALA